MALEITTTWFAAYVVLSLLAVIGTLYAFIISITEFKGALRSALIATVLINIGIILHTYAVFAVGTDNAKVIEFTVSHIFLLIGVLVTITTGSKIREMGEEIGFGE